MTSSTATKHHIFGEIGIFFYIFVNNVAFCYFNEQPTGNEAQLASEEELFTGEMCVESFGMVERLSWKIFGGFYEVG